MPAHLRSLTSLRFFGAALVVLYHAAIQSSPDGYSPPYAVLRFGYLGVSFFFVLSGFVLVWSARPDDSTSHFYRRRFARVWPVHAATLAAASLLAALGLLAQRGPAWSALLNGSLLQAWSRDGNVAFGFNGVSWSLSDEAFFYAMFPLLLLLVRKLGPLMTMAVSLGWLALGGTVAELTGDGWWAGTLPVYRVGEFLLGMGLALLVKRGCPPVRPRLALLSLAITYLGLAVANRVTAGELAPRSWLAALVVLPAISMVLVAFAQSDLSGHESWLSRPAMVRLGHWSFALYMVHELVLRAARPIMLDHPWTSVVAIAASVALAGLIYERFEQPMERWIRTGSRHDRRLQSART